MSGRKPSEINRLDAEGNPERLCKTPGCGWHRLEANFYYYHSRDSWSPRCIECTRKKTAKHSALHPRARKVPRKLPPAIPEAVVTQITRKGQAVELPSLSWDNLLR